MILRVALLAVALCARPALAQMELGLDLTDSADHRPTLAVVGVAATDRELPADQWEKFKMNKVAAQLVAAAQKSGVFASVLPSTEVFAKISDQYTDALGCTEVACFVPLAVKLDVNQVMTGQLVRKEGKTVLRLLSFTRYSNLLEVTEVRAHRGAAAFERDALAAVSAAAEKAAAGIGALALLKVKSNTAGATATLGQHPLGSVPFQKGVPPGNYVLKVQAEGFLTEEVELKLGAGETREIEANLISKALESPPAIEPPAPTLVEKAEPGPPATPLWRRPGLYVAVAGLALAGVGLAVGSGAKAVEARAKDGNGDGALDITRRDASAARRNAALANVLVGAGGAAVAGGVVWIFLTPAPQPGRDLGPVEVAGLTLGIAGPLP